MARINIAEMVNGILTGLRGFVWFESRVNVSSKLSKRECKNRGIDPESLYRVVRVCLLPVKHYRDWLEGLGFELPPAEESKFTPLKEGEDCVVKTEDGAYLLRGVVIHQTVLDTNISEDDYRAVRAGGILNNSAVGESLGGTRKTRQLYNHKHDCMMDVPNYVSYRADRILGEDGPPPPA